MSFQRFEDGLAQDSQDAVQGVGAQHLGLRGQPFVNLFGR
jgi:hypothetical protein